MAIEDVEKLIEKHKPRVVFAPHVETSTGVELPLEYIKRIGEMTRRASDGIFVLDASRMPPGRPPGVHLDGFRPLTRSLIDYGFHFGSPKSPPTCKNRA